MSLTGSLLLYDTDHCNQDEFQLYLQMIRSLWRGWHLVLFLDRDASHTAEASVSLAEGLGIALRWLPVACPMLNPMDHLWRHMKGDILANNPGDDLNECVAYVYQYLQDMGPAGWMRKAGLFSETFWLKEYCTRFR
jgi:hypothetical protein